MNDPGMRNTGCSWPIATIYVMQGEIYSDMPYGQHGSAEFSVEMLLRNARRVFKRYRRNSIQKGVDPWKIGPNWLTGFSIKS